MNSQDSKPTRKPEDTMNWADYADALARPTGSQMKVMQRIKGRRLRDQYLDEVVIVKVEQPES
jgi:hypothetical protein